MARSEHDILADVKKLAIEYYELTGKPLGVTGEIAEVEAADKLGLELAEARTEGYDAIRRKGKRPTRIQIKGRRILDGKPLYQGRVSKIDLTKPFDTVALVLLDQRYNAVEIWEAPRAKVEARITAPVPRRATNADLSGFRSSSQSPSAFGFCPTPKVLVAPVMPSLGLAALAAMLF